MMRILCGVIAALISLAAAPAAAGPAHTTSSVGDRSERANWRVRTAWVKELDPEEQSVVLLLMRSALNEKLFKLIDHNGGERGENLRWIIGVQSWGNYLLSELATKDPEFRSTFRDVSDHLLPIYLGRKPLASYVDFSNEVTERLRDRASKMDLRRADKIAKNYSHSIERASASTIVTAMLASSSGLTDKSGQ